MEEQRRLVQSYIIKHFYINLAQDIGTVRQTHIVSSTALEHSQCNRLHVLEEAYFTIRAIFDTTR